MNKLNKINRWSPQEVSGPPIRIAVVGIHVEEHFSDLFPAEESHGEQKTRNTEEEEI